MNLAKKGEYFGENAHKSGVEGYLLSELSCIIK